jgi:hypothetical protein
MKTRWSGSGISWTGPYPSVGRYHASLPISQPVRMARHRRLQLAKQRVQHQNSRAAMPKRRRSVPIKGGVDEKKGSGAIDDTSQLRTMLDLLAMGQAASVHGAARQVAESTARTSQSRAAEIGRLLGKFAKAHGTEPPEGKTWLMLQPNRRRIEGQLAFN